jgi:hypothetical protein
MGLEGRERAGQLQRARFSKIAYYLRDNVILINIIRIEASGQQENGIGLWHLVDARVADAIDPKISFPAPRTGYAFLNPSADGFPFAASSARSAVAAWAWYMRTRA